MAAEPIILFKGTLTSSYQPTKPVMLVGNQLPLDFDLDVSGVGGVVVRWYLEFSTSLAGPWFRELAEEDNGGGNVMMPIAIRTFAVNGGTSLPTGSYQLSAQLSRVEPFARLQMAVTSGSAIVTVSTPLGVTPQAAS